MSSLYNVVNRTGATVFLSDDGGELLTIGPGGATVALSTSGYQQAVRTFGQTNVVLVASGNVSTPYVYTSAGDQTIQVTSSSAVALNPPPGATVASIQVAGGNVRYRSDGVSPTTSIGTEVVAGGTFQLSVQDFTKVSFIAESATVTISIEFFR